MSRGLMRKLSEIFFSSSSCSFVLFRSIWADDKLNDWSFFWMVKLGPFCCFCSLRACIMAWRFFSASSRRRLFSSMSLCFFSSISRTLLSSSCFLRSAMRFSSSARITLRLDCFSLSRLRSSSSFARCLRHSAMYSLSCSSRADDFCSWRLTNSGSPFSSTFVSTSTWGSSSSSEYSSSSDMIADG